MRWTQLQRRLRVRLWKTTYDGAIVIGAGPTGLACGIELKRRDVDTLIIDKGCVVNSLYHYPDLPHDALHYAGAAGDPVTFR